MLEVVVLVVVGMLVKCRGPYVVRQVVSETVEVIAYDATVDCWQPIAIALRRRRGSSLRVTEEVQCWVYCNANVLGISILHSRRAY